MTASRTEGVDSSALPRTAGPERAAVWFVASVLIAGAVAAGTVVLDRTGLAGVDVQVYRDGGAALLRGEPLYDMRSGPYGLLFTYPPIDAVVFTLLAILPLGVATGVWAFTGVFALEAVIWLLLGAVGVTATRRAMLTAVGTLASFTLAPVS